MSIQVYEGDGVKPTTRITDWCVTIVLFEKGIKKESLCFLDPCDAFGFNLKSHHNHRDCRISRTEAKELKRLVDKFRKEVGSLLSTVVKDWTVTIEPWGNR